MFERVLIALALLALFAAVVWLGRRWYARRNERIEERLRASAGPATAAEGGASASAGDDRSSTGVPRIVYFTTRSCLVCKTQQEPAIDTLRDEVPEVVIEQYDAVHEADLAKEYGVLLVPTTAVYDRRGELVAINRGFAPAVRLRAQVEGRATPVERKNGARTSAHGNN